MPAPASPIRENRVPPPEPIIVSTADELAGYIRHYYCKDGQENAENRYILDGNYKLTQTYSQYAGDSLIPDYPQTVTADALPYSATFICKDGDFYSKHVSTAYGCSSTPAYYFREEQSHELYYNAADATGYAVVTADTQKFDIYPEFAPKERTYEARNRWTFPAADAFEAAKAGAADSVVSLLGLEIMSDLFKVDIADWTDPLPPVDRNGFEKMAISQNGDVVSFELVYSDATLSSTAKGTINVSALDFAFTYTQIRHEETGTIESQYTFALAQGADETIDFDINGSFEESSDYIS